PPAIPRAEIARLLPGTPALLGGGRRVIYACSDCASLGCGAVTAVVERADSAVIWRDFAWQTDEPVDLEREGYAQVGPFRFRPEEYRATLTELLADPAGDGAGLPRVLLIGERARHLTRLAAALRPQGVRADTARDAADAGRIPAAGLRSYGAVVLGPTAAPGERAAVRDLLAAAGAGAVCVDGLAPVVPLLLAQIEEALDRRPCAVRRLGGLTAGPGGAGVDVASACRVRLTAYRPDRVHRTRGRTLFDGTLPPGHHRIPLDPGTVRARDRAFLVARTLGQVLVTPAAAP
ncbi:oxidoreductase, partial [Streptomyces clavuligerus]